MPSFWEHTDREGDRASLTKRLNGTEEWALYVREDEDSGVVFLDYGDLLNLYHAIGDELGCTRVDTSPPEL